MLFDSGHNVDAPDPLSEAPARAPKTRVVELEALIARAESLSLEEFVERARELMAMAGFETEFEQILKSARRRYAPAPRPALPARWTEPAIPPRRTQRPLHTRR